MGVAAGAQLADCAQFDTRGPRCEPPRRAQHPDQLIVAERGQSVIHSIGCEAGQHRPGVHHIEQAAAGEPPRALLVILMGKPGRQHLPRRSRGLLAGEILISDRRRHPRQPRVLALRRPEIGVEERLRIKRIIVLVVGVRHRVKRLIIIRERRRRTAGHGHGRAGRRGRRGMPGLGRRHDGTSGRGSGLAGGRGPGGTVGLAGPSASGGAGWGAGLAGPSASGGAGWGAGLAGPSASGGAGWLEGVAGGVPAGGSRGATGSAGTMPSSRLRTAG